jgi:4-amino-4-deoxy-L-arabinose transferase-like glycosyltransferase
MKIANHPVNLAIRFFLELAGLYALGYWGWTQHTGAARFLWAILLPLAFAALWGVFRTPADHGKGLVAIPGAARLVLEAAYFGAAIWALYAAGQPEWGLNLAAITIAHYVVSYQRVISLLKS